MRRALPIVANQVGALVLGLVGLRLLSYFVPPAVNGAYALFLTLTQLGTLLTHAGLINHASRNWQSQRGRSDEYGRFLWQTSLVNLGYLAAVLVVVCAVLFIETRQSVWLWALPILLAGNFALVLTEIAVMCANVSERHWVVCWSRLGTGASRLFLPLVFAIIFGASLLTLTMGFALHGVGVLVVGLLVFRRLTTPRARDSQVTLQWRQELRSYGRPFVLMGVGGWLLLHVDRWIVAKFFGPEQAGLFALAATLAAIVPTFFCSLLMQRFFPEIFRKADQATNVTDWQLLSRLCDKVTLLFLGLALAGLGVLHWVGPYLVGWLIDIRYAPALGMLLAAGLGGLTVQSNQFQYLLLQGQRDSVGMVKVMGIVAAVKTAASLLGALFSWEIFLGSLVLAGFVCPVIGRGLIRSIALETARRREFEALPKQSLQPAISDP